MTKLTNGISGVFAASPTGIVDPYAPGQLRIVFHLDSADQTILNACELVDKTNDAEFVSLTTTNPTGLYLSSGDTISLTHRGTSPRECSILGNYMTSSPVPGETNLYRAEIVASKDNIVHAVCKFPPYNHATPLTSYSVQVYGVLPDRPVINRFEVRLLYDDTLLYGISERPIALAKGSDWESGVSTIGHGFVGDIPYVQFSVLVATPFRCEFSHLFTATFEVRSSSLVGGPDGVFMDISMARFFGEGPTEVGLITALDECVYTDAREARRVPFSIHGMRTVAYDYMQPELWELGPQGVMSFRDGNGDLVPAATTLDEFYCRVEFTHGAPALLDIGHPYRLLANALDLVYQPGSSGRLIVGPSWRVAPGYDEIDGVYEILLRVDKTLGSGSAVAYIEPYLESCRSRSGVSMSGEIYAAVTWLV
eukprot:jgi/Mesvir1/3657/Mv14949-RA.1